MPITYLNPAGEVTRTPEQVELDYLRDLPKGVLPRWMTHRPWPIGFILAVDMAREEGSRDRVRGLYKKARAVLKADKRGDTARADRLIQSLRDAYDADVTITAHPPESPRAQAIANGTFDRKAYIAELEARYGEPVLFSWPPLDPD